MRKRVLLDTLSATGDIAIDTKERMFYTGSTDKAGQKSEGKRSVLGKEIQNCGSAAGAGTGEAMLLRLKIEDILSKINDVILLERIYRFIKYVYIHKA